MKSIAALRDQIEQEKIKQRQLQTWMHDATEEDQYYYKHLIRKHTERIAEFEQQIKEEEERQKKEL